MQAAALYGIILVRNSGAAVGNGGNNDEIDHPDVTALYARLSKDDELQGESNFISNHDVMNKGWIIPQNITS